MKNKKQEVRIALTQQSFIDLLNLGAYCVVDLAHLPFEEFIIECPNQIADKMAYETMEEMYDRFIGNEGKSEAEKRAKLESMMKDLEKERLEFKVKVNDRTLTISDRACWELDVIFKDLNYDSRNIEQMEELIEDLKFKSKNESVVKDFENDEKFIQSILSTINLSLGILSFLQSDNETIVKPRTKIDIQTKKNKKGKTSNKTYIYKKRYVFEDDILQNSVKDEIEKNNTRQYTRKTESWYSRGYWKTLKDGTKSWVRGSVKRAKGIVENITKEYKITKVK